MFIVSVYIDRERWVSGIEPLLYPSRVSFYRSFSYRDDYFEPVQLSQQLRDPQHRATLLSHPTVLGLRFNAPEDIDYHGVFVPLRKITLSDCETGDNIDLRFRLGEFIVPERDVSSGELVLPRLTLATVVGNVSKTKLFILLNEPEKEIVEQWKFQEDLPDRFWTAFEHSLPPFALTRLHGTTVMRLLDVRDRKHRTTMSIERIDAAQGTWGVRLVQGRTYDVRLRHYRIVQAGRPAPPITYHFCVSNRAEDVQCSQRAIRLIGNYRIEQIWINPLVATAAPMLFSIEPCTLEDDAQIADPTMSHTIGLSIPILIKSRFWSLTRIVNLVIVFVFLLICVMGILVYFNIGESGQKLLIVIIAAACSVVVTAAKEFFLPNK